MQGNDDQLPSASGESEEIIQQLKQRLLDLEKKADLADVSRYVGHEIKNLIILIIHFLNDNASHLKSEQSLERSLEAANKILSLSEELMQGEQKQKSHFETASPLVALHKTIKLMQKLFDKAAVQVETHLDADILVSCDISQLQQVFLNIFMNAIDSMDGKQNKKISVKTFADEKYFSIEIKDNGKGMTEEQRLKAFQPFYSTKKNASRSNAGIGLSVCREIIVKRHMGKLRIDSELNKGTSLTVSLNRLIDFKD